MTKYIIASSQDWFDKQPKSDPYKKLDIISISRREDLNLEMLQEYKPRYIFFPHWNWKVSSDIVSRYECVAFHTAPLPYGRGGSPIQNLIIRGFTSSPIYALKMTETIDGGPIYGQCEISLDGTIEDIFKRIATSIEKMIVSICETQPTPSPQVGIAHTFKRLTRQDNELSSDLSLVEMYDRIRMVDGEGYPKAYIVFGDYRIELSQATLSERKLEAMIKILYNNGHSTKKT